jgi:hypothetical protein
MRWRSGVTPGVDGFMILLLSMNEADCLAVNIAELPLPRATTAWSKRLPRERFSPQTICRRSTSGRRTTASADSSHSRQVVCQTVVTWSFDLYPIQEQRKQ